VYYYLFGSGAKKIILDFLLITNYSQQSPLIKNLSEGAIKVNPQNEACQLKDGSHSGSAKGDYHSGEICISYQQLQRLPPQVINEEVFKLLIHELSHLSGFNEERAVGIQKLLSMNRFIYSDENEPGFISNLYACDREEIDKEIKEMESSKYWQQQKARLLELLTGSQPRGCTGLNINEMTDKIDIFSDDAEWLVATGKFPRSGFRWYERKPEDSHQYTPAVALYTDWVQDISTVATVFVGTTTASITIPAKMGTNAQCSPKILLANLIANIPDILKMGCGGGGKNDMDGIQVRIAKEKEILTGEKDQK
jgi:hypothetical protein